MKASLRLTISALLALVLLSAAGCGCLNGTSTETVLPFLTTDGIDIVTESGEKVLLEGANFGGWLLWEGSAYGLPNYPEHQFRCLLEERLPPKTVDTFFGLIRDSFITSDDFKRAGDAGLDYIRLPFHYRYVNEDRETVLDQAVDWAGENGIYVILDMHAAPGCQNSDYHSDSAGTAGLWNSPEDQEEFIHLWEVLAERYKDEPAVAGFELLNEPEAEDGAMLTDLYARTISAIREIDDRHIIFLDGNNYAADFSVFEPPLGNNTVYVFHTYAGVVEAERQSRQYLEFRDRHQVPVMCNEFGEYGLTRVFSRTELHPAWWSFKMVRAGPDVPYLHMPEENTWKVWLTEIASARRASEEETLAKALEVIDGAALSPGLNDALVTAFSSSEGFNKKEVMRIVRSYPEEGPELRNLNEEIQQLIASAEADAVAQALLPLRPGELEELISSLASDHWSTGALLSSAPPKTPSFRWGIRAVSSERFGLTIHP
ncbi:MAG: glycoside hydrolase family 5 protein [Actinobacteria bacterium]|nr:glycoside hydrolase family 5 protein [Actinomycetota bacterium]MCG2819405.1 glycoside hydrolase family 5 protein [Actinomycetes bacterium]MBU4218639.1 glycoside hydrolase family 5 protein [Actinomycetota bacterium]MBU4359908.1 glycoside hydrolase family 5 protein [Actinomycetota bacterium]MBU4392689.1 glycoside hydrolase family 5 protein [Actinomycetota bacterium]